MREQAEHALEALLAGLDAPALTLFDVSFHQSVVGIFAGRVKDGCTGRPSSSRAVPPAS